MMKTGGPGACSWGSFGSRRYRPSPKIITPPVWAGGATMGSGGRLSKVPNGAQLFIGGSKHARNNFAKCDIFQGLESTPQARKKPHFCMQMFATDVCRWPNCRDSADDDAGDPGRTRTTGLRFRKPPLYPAELRGHAALLQYFRLAGQRAVSFRCYFIQSQRLRLKSQALGT